MVSCFAAAHLLLLATGTASVSRAAWLAGALCAFAVYVVILYSRTIRDSSSRESRTIYWIDAGWYLLFIHFTGGPASHFSFFLPFPVLFVALRWGFAPGIALSVASTTILLVMGIATRGSTTLLAANVVVPPIALLVLGYLIATWANAGLALNRRLESLKGISGLFTPRMSLEEMFERAVLHLAKLHHVDKYVLLVAREGQRTRVYRGTTSEPMYRVADAAADEMAAVLGRPDVQHAVIYRGGDGLSGAELHGLASPNATRTRDELRHAHAAAHRLDCLGFGAVQFSLHQGGTARLFVCSSDRSFGPAELPFFHQFADQLMPRIENVQLLDSLASEVASHERQRISRDIHDSTIQPYIGLKFALEALARKAAPTDPLARDIGSLVEMANHEIAELRRYTKALRGQSEPRQSELVPAIRRQATRFGELYGIQVEVEGAAVLQISDRLAEGVFHMVSEGLSNIRRHTSASSARVHLSCDARTFVLRIVNSSDASRIVKQFTPWSIEERASALGGSCRVEVAASRETVVNVELPMQC